MLFKLKNTTNACHRVAIFAFIMLNDLVFMDSLFRIRLTASEQIHYAYQNHFSNSTVFAQVIEKKLPDICDQLRVNHCFLSVFVSAGLLEIKHVDQIMKVNGKIAEWNMRLSWCVVFLQDKHSCVYHIPLYVLNNALNHIVCCKYTSEYIVAIGFAGTIDLIILNCARQSHSL